MRKTFSFTGSPIQSVLEQAHEAVPGVEKVLAIFFDEQLFSIRALISQRDNQGVVIEEVDKIEEMQTIVDMRNSSSPITWRRKDEIPFDITAASKNTITMFDELYNTVLVLSFPNEKDGGQDLLFYYFSTNTSNFGVSHSSRDLTTEHKGMISHMLYHFVRSLLKDHKKNQQQLLSINKNTQNAIHQIKALKKQLLEKDNRYKRSITSLCLQYVKEMEQVLNSSIQLTQEALDKLIAYDGDINNLKKIIEQAAIFAQTVNIGYSVGDIEIDDVHINFDIGELIPAQSYKRVNLGVRDERIQKTIAILDTMEKTARGLKERNVKLTSENLGRSLPSSKGASGITDQLKNHKMRIKNLFEEYPKRWNLIRSEFTPIRNISSK